jgi:anti-sigma factor RsiW
MTPAEEQRALEEALDRLLDPLADERPPPPMPEIVPLDAVPRDRAVLRISRRLAGWAIGLAVFWATIWIVVR